MTIQELKQLQILPRIIEYERERLKKIRAAAGIKGPSYTGMTHGTGIHDRISDNIPAAVDLERKIMKQLQEHQDRRNRIEAWLSKQPMKIQMIVRLRFIEGMTWNEVTNEFYAETGNPKSEDAIRKYLDRYLKAEGEWNEGHQNRSAGSTAGTATAAGIRPAAGTGADPEESAHCRPG